MEIVEVVMIMLALSPIIGAAILRLWEEGIKPFIDFVTQDSKELEPQYCGIIPTEFYYKDKNTEISEKVTEETFFRNLNLAMETEFINGFGITIHKQVDKYVINRCGNVWTLIIL